MSDGDIGRQEQEREFQRRVLAAIEGPKRNRFIRVINAPIIIWFLTLLFVVVAGGLYTNYRACIADSKQLINAHNLYRNEINYREDKIAEAIQVAKTIADVRKAIASRPFENPDLKDRPIAELLGKYRTAYLRIDGHVGGIDGNPILEQSPLYQKYRILLWGYLDPKATDADLPDLKAFADQVRAVYVVSFLQRLTTIAEIHCSLANVFLISLGESPITVREIDTKSAAQVERLSHPIDLLPPAETKEH